MTFQWVPPPRHPGAPSHSRMECKVGLILRLSADSSQAIRQRARGSRFGECMADLRPAALWTSAIRCRGSLSRRSRKPCISPDHERADDGLSYARSGRRAVDDFSRKTEHATSISNSCDGRTSETVAANISTWFDCLGIWMLSFCSSSCQHRLALNVPCCVS